MRTTKKKRLEAAGWAVGTADEFLGLSPEESKIVEMKLALGDSLRRRREAVPTGRTERASGTATESWSDGSLHFTPVRDAAGTAWQSRGRRFDPVQLHHLSLALGASMPFPRNGVGEFPRSTGRPISRGNV